jgi:hypothetical protein
MRTLIGMALALLAAGPLASQSIMRLTYSTAAPVGPTQDYISEFSWLGIMFEPGKFVRDNLSASLSFGWTVLDEQTDDPVQIGDAAGAQGTQFRYLNVFPVMAGLQLHRQNPRGGSVYLGLNAGTYFIERRTDFSVVSAIDDNWHFGLAPQLGVIFPLGYGRGHGNIDVRYHHAFEAGGHEYDWVSFSIGVAYGPRY